MDAKEEQILKAIKEKDDSSNPWDNFLVANVETKVLMHGTLVAVREANGNIRGEENLLTRPITYYTRLYFISDDGKVVDIEGNNSDINVKCTNPECGEDIEIHDSDLFNGEFFCNDHDLPEEIERQDHQELMNIVEKLKQKRNATGG